MRHRGRWARSILLAAAALLALGGAAAGQTAPAAPKKPAAREDNWPKKIRFGEMTVFLDAPQAESLEGTKLKARGEARVLRGEGGEPSFGTVWYEADVEINRDRRTVTLVSVQVPKVELPGAPPAQQQRLATRLGHAVTRLAPNLSLDDVLPGTTMARGREETT